ncbi:MAG: porin [Pseudomonadota bacterium]
MSCLRVTCTAALALALPCTALAADAPDFFQPVMLGQVWVTAWDQDRDPQADPAGYGDPEDDPGFKLRRARLGAEGELGKGFGYEIVFGAESPYDSWSQGDEDIQLVDANVGWKKGDFEITVGQQKVPYSLEQLISAKELVYTERAVATAHMVPGRETGLVAGYSWKGLGLKAGLFNGSGSFLGDDNIGFLTAGRLSYTLGDPEQAMKTWGPVDGVVLSAAANGFYNDDLSTGTLCLGGDLLFRVAGLSVLLEGDHANLTPTHTSVAAPDVLDGTPRLGLTGQVGYSLGAFENALRFSLFDDNSGVEDNGDVWELYGGTTVHLVDDHARVGVGYVHRHEIAGQTLPNDTIRLWVQGKY